jgi:TetR/AcrR family transcriptional regulator, ethionamide resistance regulator
MTAVPPGVRRRRPSKGDLTSQAILDAAERLLADRDITGITIDELASGAGISRSAFYFHFESREAVLYLLAERILSELYATAGAWVGRRGASPEDDVRRAIAGTLALWRKHGPVLRAAVRARETDPNMRQFWSDVARRFITAVADQIDAERAAGIAGPGPRAKSLATALISMNDEVFFHHSRSRKSAAADREIVDTLTTVWMRSVYGN